MRELKPRKAFLKDELNIDRLTPIQWDGIIRAMQSYAEHYHEIKVATTPLETEASDICHSISDCNYKDEYINWRDKYFTKVTKVYQYRSKYHKTYHTARMLHKQYEKAMLESPFL